VLETDCRGFTWLGEFFKRFNTLVIDGVGDGIPHLLGQFAKCSARSIGAGAAVFAGGDVGAAGDRRAADDAGRRRPLSEI